MDVVVGIYTADTAKLIALVALHRQFGSEDVAVAIATFPLWRLPRHCAQAVPLLMHQEAQGIA